MNLAELTPSFVQMGFIFIMGIIVPSSQGEVNDGALQNNYLLWNAALCKPVHQPDESWRVLPDDAVNGFRGGNICAHTSKWWMVDLTGEYLVHQIVVTSRKGIEERFNSVLIYLFLSDPREDPSFPANTNGTLCTNVTSTFEGTKPFDCPSPTYARFVKLARTDFVMMNFCELEVMVSQKRFGPESRRIVSKSFDILRNSIEENGHIVFTTTAYTALMCTRMCAERRYCNGCHWTEATRDCQMLNIDTHSAGQVVNKEGTDLYKETEIQCLGDGKWTYV